MDARAWLPADAAPPPALTAALATCVAGWAKRWFARRPPVLRPLVRGPGTPMAWRERDGMLLGIAPAGVALLGAALLDVAAEERGDADRDLLERLGEACLDDLRGVLAQAFATRGDWRPALDEPCQHAPVGTLPIATGLSAERFATLARRHLPPPAPVPLGSIATALAVQPVRVGAVAGHASLTVADLAALATGDVVLLDGRVAEPMALAIDGRSAVRGRASVVVAGPVPFLKITEPLSA